MKAEKIPSNSQLQPHSTVFDATYCSWCSWI